MWLSATGNVDLLEKSIKAIRSTQGVCSAHFERKDYKSTRVLEVAALPTKCDHEGPIPIELMIEFAAKNNVEKYLKPVVEEIVPPVLATSDHNYCKYQLMQINHDLLMD